MSTAAWLIANTPTPATVADGSPSMLSAAWLILNTPSAPATVVVASSTTLSGAIIRRFKATPALVTLVPGGLYFGVMPDKAKRTVPYGVLDEITEVPFNNTTGVAHVASEFQVAFFGKTADAVKAIKRAWDEAFNTKSAALDIAGWSFVQIMGGSSHMAQDEGEDEDADPLVQQVIEFTVLLGRRTT